MSANEPIANATREAELSALFEQLVFQQTNMAMMLMGKLANPQTGETMHDLDAARYFIDQLEMLEAKTRGNLNRSEEALLKQGLMSLRMAFVDAVNKSAEKPAPTATAAPESAPTPTPDDDPTGKRFTKKY